MHKKVHGSVKYRCLTISYSILSDFKRIFSTLIHPPHHPHDQYAREVLVCCEGAVSYLACLLAGLFISCLLACLLACLDGTLADWLLACLLTSWLADWLVSWLVACLLCWLVWLLACLLARSLARLLSCLLFWFALLTYFDLLCLLDLRGSRGWTPETQPNDALRRRLVDFLVFNLLALACLNWLACLFAC